MKCTRCGERAVLDLARHNAAFCAPCLTHYAHEQVRRAIDEHTMLNPGDRVLVAVSGGKDSLALWHILRALGYEADGLYLGLGIGDYSDASTQATEAFARDHGWPLRVIDLRAEFDFDIPGAASATDRPACSACGISKRHLFDRAALEGGYDALATGHNLDDEAAVLLGNVLRWELDALARQAPVLPARPGFPRKVKPLVRLQERETAAYCVVTGIDYIVEECPMAFGNRHLGYKDALTTLETQSPGSRAAFIGHFYSRGRQAFVHADGDELAHCSECGAPTHGSLCQFCRLRSAAAGVEAAPTTRRRRREQNTAPL